jgi:hypothetical protein
MFTTTHKLAAAVALIVTALSLGVLQAGMASKQAVAENTPVATPLSSQPNVADLDW